MAIAGEIAVLFTARTDAFTKGVSAASKSIERVAGKFKQVGSEVGRFGAVMAGVGALLVREANKYDTSVRTQVDRLQGAYAHLAIEVAQTLLPTLRRLADAVTGLAVWFKNLDPQVKESAANFALVAVQALAVVAAVGKLAGIAGALSGLLGVIAPLAPALLAVVAAATALWYVAGFVREAWDTNMGGIRDTAAAVWAGIVDGVTTAGRFIGEAAENIARWWYEGFQGIKRTVLGWAEGVINAVERVARFLGKDLSDAADVARTALDWLDHITTIDGMKEAMVDFGRATADAFRKGSDGAKKNMESLEKLIQKLKEAAGLGGLGESNETLGKPKEIGEGEAPVMRFDEMDIEGRMPLPKFETEISAASSAIGSVAAGLGAFGATLGGVTAAIVSGLSGDVAGATSAIVGVVMDLLNRMQPFINFVTILNSVFQDALDMVAGLIEDLTPFAGALAMLAGAVLEMVSPLFRTVGIFDVLTPVISILATTLEALAPAFKAMLNVLLVVGHLNWPFLLLAKALIPPLFHIIKFVGIVLLRAIRLVAPLWNVVADTMAGIVGFLVGLQFDLPGVGTIKPFEWLGPVHDSLKGMHLSLVELDMSISELENSTEASAKAKAAETAASILNKQATEAAASAAGDMADAVDKVTASLTNVPEGFKVNKARYNATSSSGPFDRFAERGTGGGNTTVVLNVAGSVYGIEDLLRKVEETAKKKTFQKTSVPYLSPLAGF